MYMIPVIEGQSDISLNSSHPDNDNLLHFDSLEVVFQELIVDSLHLPKWPQDSVDHSRSDLPPTFFKKYLAQQSS